MPKILCRPLNSIFTYNNELYKVISTKYSLCKECAFHNKDRIGRCTLASTDFHSKIGYCIAMYRDDKLCVIFKKLSKENRICQNGKD